MVVRRERVLSATPAEVWGVVSDPDRLAALVAGRRRASRRRRARPGRPCSSRRRASPCAPTTAWSRPRSRERVRWRHEVEESPFERLLSESTTEIALSSEGEGGTARPAHARPAPARLGALQPLPAARGRAPPGRERAGGTGRAARGRVLMRWWGWGEDGHAVPLPPAAEGLLRDELGADPGVRKPPVALDQVALPDPGLPGDGARAAGGGGRRGARARRPRDAHRARRRALAIPTSCGSAPATPRARPTPSCCPESAEQVAARPGRVRRAAGRGRPVRRRHQRRRRRRAACATASRRRSRSTSARLTATVEVDRTSLTARARRRPARARGRAAAARAGRDARPLPAVVRVLDRRRLGGHALGGPGVDRLRAHRRAGRGAALRHAGRRARHEAGAGLGGGPERCASWSWAPRASSA